MRRVFPALLLLLSCASPILAQEVAVAPAAVLRGLDKVSGLTSDIEVSVGQTAIFGRLSITLQECRYPSEDQFSDAYALLEISETADKIDLFSGWMIASSPALNALDHSRFDVWVLRCKIE